MKRILFVGLLTACALATSEHQANAWVNAKFSIGLNWHVQSANNNVLWGLWKNGQVPGPEAFGQPGGGGPFTPGQMTPGGSFPYFGGAPNGTQPNAAQPNGVPVNFPQQINPTMPGAVGQQGFYPYPMQYYYQQQAPAQTPNNLFRTASYQQDAYYYQPSAYYPMYQSYYGQQQVPYYWYQQR